MNSQISGKAFVFGANIDTDQIYPGRFVELTDVKDVAKHAMEGADPNFVHNFKTGDIIIAATNFGCGSSREHAAITLKAVGVGVVIAESFGRIFYRNAINLGLPLLVCPKISTVVKKDDIIEADLISGKIYNKTSGITILAEPISDYVMDILQNGGIKPMLKKQMSKRN